MTDPPVIITLGVGERPMPKVKALQKAPVTQLRQRRPSGTASLTAVKTMQVLERRFQVVELRRDGYSIREIAETLNISHATAMSDLRETLKITVEQMSETVEENRQIAIERIDALLKRYMPLATGGNLGAAGMVLALETRRSKLLALDVPETKKVEHSGIREYVGVDVGEV